MKSGPRILAMLGTNLMLFSAVLLLAWGAHDRMTAGVIVGITLAMSLWHFFLSRGKAGSAAIEAYNQGRKLTEDDLSKMITDTVPLSRTMDEQIKAIKSWAHDRAMPASKA